LFNLQGQTNTFGTPGVYEHALFMKHVSDAMSLRKKLFDQLEKASLPCTSREEAAALLHLVIVGGGPTGKLRHIELWSTAHRMALMLPTL
jgi:NADH dehydrogenase FAD-containing subunit